MAATNELQAWLDKNAREDLLKRIAGGDDSAIWELMQAMGVVRCEGCGLSYGLFPLDVIVPDDQWRAITGRDDGGGILCASCIVARGARIPGVTVAKLVFE